MIYIYGPLGTGLLNRAEQGLGVGEGVKGCSGALDWGSLCHVAIKKTTITSPC